MRTKHLRNKLICMRIFTYCSSKIFSKDKIRTVFLNRLKQKQNCLQGNRLVSNNFCFIFVNHILPSFTSTQMWKPQIKFIFNRNLRLSLSANLSAAPRTRRTSCAMVPPRAPPLHPWQLWLKPLNANVVLIKWQPPHLQHFFFLYSHTRKRNVVGGMGWIKFSVWDLGRVRPDLVVS